MSKKEQRLHSRKEAKKTFQAEAFCFPYSLKNQVYIHAEDEQIPALFMTKLHYEIDLINQDPLLPVCAQYSFDAQADIELIYESQKVQNSSIIALEAMIEGTQDLIPDLDEDGRYKVWIPSFYENSNKSPVYFRTHLIHKYLGKDAGLFGA